MNVTNKNGSVEGSLPPPIDQEKIQLLEKSKAEFSKQKKIKLVITGLPDNVDLQDLKSKIFQGYDVKDLVIGHVKNTATVVFGGIEQARSVISFLNTCKYHDKTLNVSPAPPESLLFVGNLPFEFTETQFGDLMSPYGNIERLFLVRSEVTGDSKGYGFVEYATRENAMQAKQQLLNTASKYIGGRILRVAFAESNLLTYADVHSRTLFVDRLPRDFKNGGLIKELFSQTGNVTFAQVAINPANGGSRGFAFVDYATAEEAEKGQRAHNGRQVEGSNIRVAYGSPGRTGASILGSQLDNTQAGYTTVPQPMDPPQPLMAAQPVPPLNVEPRGLHMTHMRHAMACGPRMMPRPMMHGRVPHIRDPRAMIRGPIPRVPRPLLGPPGIRPRFRPHGPPARMGLPQPLLENGNRGVPVPPQPQLPVNTSKIKVGQGAAPPHTAQHQQPQPLPMQPVQQQPSAQQPQPLIPGLVGYQSSVGHPVQQMPGQAAPTSAFQPSQQMLRQAAPTVTSQLQAPPNIPGPPQSLLNMPPVATPPGNQFYDQHFRHTLGTPPQQTQSLTNGTPTLPVSKPQVAITAYNHYGRSDQGATTALQMQATPYHQSLGVQPAAADRRPIPPSQSMSQVNPRPLMQVQPTPQPVIIAVQPQQPAPVPLAVQSQAPPASHSMPAQPLMATPMPQMQTMVTTPQQQQMQSGYYHAQGATQQQPPPQQQQASSMSAPTQWPSLSTSALQASSAAVAYSQWQQPAPLMNQSMTQIAQQPVPLMGQATNQPYPGYTPAQYAYQYQQQAANPLGQIQQQGSATAVVSRQYLSAYPSAVTYSQSQNIGLSATASPSPIPQHSAAPVMYSSQYP
ncbi:bromodomain-containing protein 4 isoform X2 [Nematostella vectensis]|uniref:bromodomain-containing protein 4 isoform X2 n=1 Tax=Nematostella vectensis TaxID=45351 RepID=UPI0020775BBD|nr:bromodomain-containing protein 4 isoform X2 [Nematostella vectensis]